MILSSKHFSMVKTAAVRGSTLACVAMVFVLLSFGGAPALQVTVSVLQTFSCLGRDDSYSRRVQRPHSKNDSQSGSSPPP